MFKKIITILMILAFQLGLSLLLFPIWNGILLDRQAEQAAELFLSEMEPTAEATQSTEATEETIPHQELWDAMCAYNEALFASKQAGLNSPNDYEQPSFSLPEYGLEDEVFGVLTARKINLEMPIYLGATETHLAHGASHLSQTSLPIGGENTNCVIAGHRGWNGAAHFRYVPDLRPGDIVTIRNLWETLTYVVVETKIIAPNDVDAIHIQEGRELLTLLTCHPYASGGKQRFLVICERVNQGGLYE